MSKKSRDARRKRRDGLASPLRDLLRSYQAPSLLSVAEAAIASPTASQRALSIARLVSDTFRMWPNGTQIAEASDLEELLDAARVRNPEFEFMEDYAPLDPRIDVRITWRNQTYRILPGTLERPVIMFERAQMVDAAIGRVLLAEFGFSVGDLAQLVLERLDEVARGLSPVWPKSPKRASPYDVPVLSQAEVEAARNLPNIRELGLGQASRNRMVVALDWATVDAVELTFDPTNGSSVFQRTLAVRQAGQRFPMPCGFWPDAFESALITLGQQASSLDRTVPTQFAVESAKTLARLFAMSHLDLVGPFSIRDEPSTLYALLVDERTIVLFDLVASLDSNHDVISDRVGQSFKRIRIIASGATLRGRAGSLHVHDDTRLVRVVILATAGHAVIGSRPNVAAASLDDLRWIVRRTRETPDDIYFFFDELARLVTQTELISFETINAFEHWLSNGKSMQREGKRWDGISIEQHRGDAEWAEAAHLSQAHSALVALRLPALSEWDGFDLEKAEPTLSMGAYPDGPYWDVRWRSPLVAIECFDPTTPKALRGVLTNVATSILWKINHSAEFQRTLGPFAESGIRVRLKTASNAGWEAIRYLTGSNGEIELGCSSDIDALASEDSPRVEASLGEALIEGLYRLGVERRLDWDRQSASEAWRACPPAFKVDVIQLPVRNPELPRPIGASTAASARVQRELARGLSETGLAPGRYELGDATRLENDHIAPILRSMLSKKLAHFGQRSVLAKALEQVERALCAKWMSAQGRRQNEGFPVLTYDPVEREVVEERDSHELTKAVILLLEEALANGSAEGEDVSRLDWIDLVAIGQLLIESYVRSESNHYQVIKSVTVIDDRYRVTQERDPTQSLIDQVALAEARARFRMAKPDTHLLGRTTETAEFEKTTINEISEAAFETFKFRLESLLAALDVGASWPLPAGQEFDEVSMTRFLDQCQTVVPDADLSQIEAAVMHLTLRPERVVEFIEHWEQERRLVRLLTRPFVQSDSGGFFVLPWQCEGSRRVFLGYLSQGRLIWAGGDTSSRLDAALNKLRESRNKSLEVGTELVCKRITPYVRRNIVKPRTIGLETTGWAGEIDCLAVDANRSIVWVADAKDAFVSFSPATIARSIERFNGPDKYVDKLLRKSSVIAAAAAEVAKALGVPDWSRDWVVQPVMVTRNVEPAAFTKGQKVPFCLLSDLEEWLRAFVPGRGVSRDHSDGSV